MLGPEDLKVHTLPEALPELIEKPEKIGGKSQKSATV
jgi:hypothetical protein